MRHEIVKKCEMSVVHVRSTKLDDATQLLHDNGLHSLIPKMLKSLEYNGKSRYVVGIRASNNNRSETVLNLFIQSIQENGSPSRVRGDHGTENIGVAEYMERTQGAGRGSYIWGRFVVLLLFNILLSQLRFIGVSTILGLNAYGMMSRTTSVRSGKNFL
jgi:hypothetical protein